MARVNRVIDHVVRNLDQPLSLDEMARLAHFSPFHFHRIFSGLVGETLHQFVKRVRLERALSMVRHEPRRTLTEIALACGFASSADFSRSFKQRYGVPPSAFDVEAYRAERREQLQDAITDADTRHLLERLPVGENPDGFGVEFRALPERQVVYLRVPDSFRPDAVTDAAARLLAWADEHGIADGQWLGYMWDDPNFTALSDCRYDVAVEVRTEDLARLDVGGEFGVLTFPEMTVAQVEVRGAIDLEQRALDWLFGTWLPSSGYVPTDQPCFEAWIGRPFAHGFEYFEIYAQIPVTRG